MRIEIPRRHERFGAVRIHEPTQVIELDSGDIDDDELTDVAGRRVRTIGRRALAAAEAEMAIVVPTKGERRKVFDGVLSGIPNPCLIVGVSASDRTPVDRYVLETDVASEFCQITERSAVFVHQDDPALADALLAAGLPTLVDENTGLVHRGKGEAMIVGILLAAAAGKRAVGFVDADNYVPGAVHEYVKAYAAGIHHAPTPYAMVRIAWQSKPKVEDGQLVFNRWGRTTQVTNGFLNQVLSTYTGFGTEMITTGNAGEHAMTMELALRLRLAGGFAVEPHQLVDLFEQFGGALPSPHPEVVDALVDVFQVETRNPHFHEDKGTNHVAGMRLEALEILYHSPVCPPAVRQNIVDFLESKGIEDAPTPGRIHPPLHTADLAAFTREITRPSSTLIQFGKPAF